MRLIQSLFSKTAGLLALIGLATPINAQTATHAPFRSTITSVIVDTNTTRSTVLATPTPPAEAQIGPAVVDITPTTTPPSNSNCAVGDSRCAIQAAINGFGHKGGTLLFAPGTYSVSINCDGQPNARSVAISVTSGIRLKSAQPGLAKIVLKANSCQYTCLDDRGTLTGVHYDAIIGAWDEPGGGEVLLHDFVIDGLNIDGSADGNPGAADLQFITDTIHANGSPPVERDCINTGDRFAFRAFIGARIEIINSTFRNFISPTIISLNGPAKNMMDVIVQNNRFEDIGFTAQKVEGHNEDSSVIYFVGQRALIADNSFASRLLAAPEDPPLGTRTAIEVHGSDLTVLHNEIAGFENGIIASIGPEGGSRQLVAHNVIKLADMGVIIWNDSFAPGVGMSDLKISDNSIQLERAHWKSTLDSADPTFGIGTYHGHSTYPVTRLMIESSDIFVSGNGLPPVKNNGPGDAGIFFSIPTDPNAKLLQDVQIVHNHVAGSAIGTPADGAVFWPPATRFFNPPQCRENLGSAGAILCPFPAVNN